MVHLKFIKEQVRFPLHTTQSLLIRSHNTVEPPRHKTFVLLVASETYHIVFADTLFDDVYWHLNFSNPSRIREVQNARRPDIDTENRNLTRVSVVGDAEA